MRAAAAMLDRKVQTVQWSRPKGSKRATYIAVGMAGERKNDVRIYPVNYSALQGTESKEPIGENEAAWVSCDGDVTDIQFIDDRQFFAGTSEGDISLFKVDKKGKRVGIRKIHSLQLHPGEITAINLDKPLENMLTVCDAGKVSVSTLDDLKEKASYFTKSPIHDVAWSPGSANEFFTVGMGARLQLWDLRAFKPTQACSYQSSSFMCCDTSSRWETTDGTIVATGSDDGKICLWDSRKLKIPMTVSEAHQSVVWKIKFLAGSTDVTVSCGEDGRLIALDFRSFAHIGPYNSEEKGPISKVLVQEDLSINCVDYEKEAHWLVTGSESGSIRFYPNEDRSSRQMILA